ncbi:LacI family DNA-binding transcriptional regulator [Yoonia sp.]|uniref:LacI family DNA-binding transcriptional regulator n=1 Tax=Yoonia sp. TaxID=2212373 RepID=UPI0019D95C2E|nr:substrate-binding domain-containing protein [Yoonia sp.]MBE0414673.1 LacI family DNA-binding transcriptional regulator [Yoonia sp.]
MNLKELSQTLGLSQTTVSRALNGYPEVNGATRERVERAARQFGYRPNVRAKGLATGRALAIGHVIPIGTKPELVNPIFGDFIAGAGETYSRYGYEMILSIIDGRNEEAVYRGLKSRRAVDGVIIHGPRISEPRISLLQEIGLPFAVHGRTGHFDKPFTWLDVNNQEAFREATNYLVDLGHRRIGLVNGPEKLDFAYRRRVGYLEVLNRHDIPVDPALMHSDPMTEDAGYAASRAMLALPDPPTALLCASLVSALGARRAVEECGLFMARDVSIITHDDALSYLQNGGDTPIFTATRSSVRDAGRRLAEMLLEAIAHPEAPPQTEVLKAELVIGQSTGPAPRKD